MIRHSHHRHSAKDGVHSDKTSPIKPNGTITMVTNGTNTRLVAMPNQLASPNQNSVNGVKNTTICSCKATKPKRPLFPRNPQTSNQVAQALSQKLAPNNTRGFHNTIATKASSKARSLRVDHPSIVGTCVIASIK